VQEARIWAGVHLSNYQGVKRFHIPNTEPSTGGGLHWVSVVYEIKRKRPNAAPLTRVTVAVSLGDQLDMEEEQPSMDAAFRRAYSSTDSSAAAAFQPTASASDSSATTAISMFALALVTIAFNRILHDLKAFAEATCIQAATAAFSAGMSYAYGGRNKIRPVPDSWK